MHEAVERGWYDLTAFLIREHADVNFPDQYGITPLHVAAVSEQPRAVHIIMALLRANADPNAQDWVRGFVDRTDCAWCWFAWHVAPVV